MILEDFCRNKSQIIDLDLDNCFDGVLAQKRSRKEAVRCKFGFSEGKLDVSESKGCGWRDSEQCVWEVWRLIENGKTVNFSRRLIGGFEPEKL